jgi:hypothetical protein
VAIDSMPMKKIPKVSSRNQNNKIIFKKSIINIPDERREP